jgi:hypothetical protein
MVIDLGKGQLVVGTVTRSEGSTIGVEFETRLISDGSGGLCTRYRVSPYALAAAGMPLNALKGNGYTQVLTGTGPQSKPMFMEVSATVARAA